MTERTYKLEELAEEAGVTVRTVRYYVQRGLLSAPSFHGRDTVYTEEHLLRLKAIRRLQERFLPLDAIQTELLRRSLDELRDIAEGREVRASVPAAPSPVGHYRTPGWVGPGTASPDARPTVWQRTVLMPGLELNLAVDATPQSHAIANEIRAFVEARLSTQGGHR